MENLKENEQPIFESLTHTEINKVITEVRKLLTKGYVFPDVAIKMVNLISEKLVTGNYSSISDPEKFAHQLTEDLQFVSNDKHIQLYFAPEEVSRLRIAKTKEENNLDNNDHTNEMRFYNFGFKEVKILDGNIGYLDLRRFEEPDYAGETAVAAMNYLSNSDAIIIDLRNNNGGSPRMIQLLTSYLYDSDPVHLNTFYWRPDDKHNQSWTLPYVPGNRMPDIDVYILTSGFTFSAAEEFCYNLRHLKRATLIGETTGGGAHPGLNHIVTDRFIMKVPHGRAINPVTQSNWEGVGVEPHVKVHADDALKTAHTTALKTLSRKHNDNTNNLYQWFLTGLKAEHQNVVVDEDCLKSYAGDFGNRILTFENGCLYYQRKGRSKFELKALEKDLFQTPGQSHFRLKILLEDGKCIGLQGLYEDGMSDESLRVTP